MVLCKSMRPILNYVVASWILGFVWRTDLVVSQNSPALPVGDINVVVVTDTHSWVGGHGDKEAPLDADYGDVLSFYRQLKSQMPNQDVFFVNNGDWIDGTGLALDGDPTYLAPILERMPWDAVNVGNHELYSKKTINYISRPAGLSDWWGPRYLSANVEFSANHANFGNQFRLLKGPTSTVLAFGFLYNMKDNNAALTVREVETVVEEEWFSDSLRKPGVDAVLVLAHMGHDDPLVSVILTKIRSVLGQDMPVQFITGHTHIRGRSFPDTASSSFEAGRYLDTVGFVSFPRKATFASSQAVSNTSDLFKSVFLDASRDVLEQALNGPALETDEGAELSAFIHKIQTELGLREVVGCAPQRFYYNKSIPSLDSVWGLFHRELVPRVFEEEDVVMLRTETARYDLLPGDITYDEVVATIAFNDTLVKYSNVPASVLLQLNATVNAEVIDWMPELPPYTFASARPIVASDQAQDANSTDSDVDIEEMYNLIISDYSIEAVRAQLEQLYPQIPEPVTLPTGSLDVWLKFFHEEHLCSTSKKGHHRPSSHPNQHNRTGVPHFGFQDMADDEKDRARLIFAVLALGMVGMLGALYVWQRGSSFRRDTTTTQMVILQAQREFDGVADYESDEFDAELL